MFRNEDGKSRQKLAVCGRAGRQERFTLPPGQALVFTSVRASALAFSRRPFEAEQAMQRVVPAPRMQCARSIKASIAARFMTELLHRRAGALYALRNAEKQPATSQRVYIVYYVYTLRTVPAEKQSWRALSILTS